jgi:hypothetical protein
LRAQREAYQALLHRYADIVESISTVDVVAQSTVYVAGGGAWQIMNAGVAGITRSSSRQSLQQAQQPVVVQQSATSSPSTSRHASSPSISSSNMSWGEHFDNTELVRSGADLKRAVNTL